MTIMIFVIIHLGWHRSGDSDWWTCQSRISVGYPTKIHNLKKLGCRGGRVCGDGV